MYFYSNDILSFDKDRQVSIIKAVIVIPSWIIISMRKRVFEKKKSEPIVVDTLISKYSLLLKVGANYFLCLNYVKNID